MKFCNKCENEKELIEFSILKNGKYQSFCKCCKNEYRNKRYKEIREVELLKNKKYREENKLILQEKRRARTGATKRSGVDPVKLKRTIKKEIKKYREKYPHKIRVNALLRQALDKGEIRKPLECEICKENKKLEGHHSDYSLPLKVCWVCRQCHVKIHREKINERLESC